MAAANQPDVYEFFLIDPVEPNRTISVKISKSESIAELQRRIPAASPNYYKDIDANTLTLYKVDIPRTDKWAQQFDEKINALPEPLDSTYSIEDYYPSAPPRKTVHILVVVPQSPQLPAKRSRSPENESERQLKKFRAGRSEYVIQTQNLPGPSSGASVRGFIHNQKLTPVLNGRPQIHYGFPIGLFNPVFDRMRSNIGDATMQLSPQDYRDARNFLEQSSELYLTETMRWDAIKDSLHSLLGSTFESVANPGVKSDGVILHQSCGQNARIAILELKNEIGAGGSDPYNQASLAYRQYWTSAETNKLRKIGYCPSIILALAGPWLCVMGAVFVQKPIIQPIGPHYIWIGGDPFDSQYLSRITRTLLAVRLGIQQLRAWYDSLTGNEEEPDGYPYICEFRGTKFKYQRRLVDESLSKLIYKAKTDAGRQIVVKFVSRYNVKAHSLLAKSGLAPNLLHPATGTLGPEMFGGRYMIVMDYFEGGHASSGLSQEHFSRIQEAVRLLHSEDLVFGDLRPPNILIGTEGVRLVDFDWCSEAGKGHYPGDINETGDIRWPEGVAPGSVMEKEHDLAMLERLGQTILMDQS